MKLENILMLDSNVTTPSDCQTLCFGREKCIKFSHFSSTSSRCVLFTKCPDMKSCSGCVSGPAYPRITSCQRISLRNGGALPTSNANRGRKIDSRQNELPRQSQNQEVSDDGEDFGEVENDADAAADNNDDDYYQYQDQDPEYEDDNTDEDDYEDEDDNIDDGLLDEVFNELPGVDNKKPPVKKSNTSSTSCPTCYPGYYYCVMGGFNRFGPVSEVSLLNTGAYPIPRSPLIAPFPSFMTKGSGSTFSTFTGRSVMTCTPGYPVTGLTPASTFGGFFTQQSYIPGTCNSYNVARRNWQSTGGKLNTVRLGGSTVRMGKYLVSIGGVSPSGYPITSIEMFDTRRAQIGWKPVPRWSFPAATRDSCTVTMKHPRNGAEMYVIGGEGQESAVMKMVLNTGQWFSLPSMYYPRRQHACTKVDMNGRPGIMISGGSDGVYTNMTSVEFFDIYRNSWTELPNMFRGRRSHVMTSIDNSIAIAGGTANTPEGDTEYLSDVEVFDGRRWKRAAYTMDTGRGGANLIKIPIRNLVA
eukprot:TRINITY_DN9205_c0_g1_i2.p1 TRINITY_DN9205_c0_g1~~TRINITY_DN9205_c0_g1_i2.p1  ORF type:complete len:527 (+),score=102.23 TRINITY_DN9205_c0_g1_i2:149-1729(+)